MLDVPIFRYSTSKMLRPWYPGQMSPKVIESGTFDTLCMVSYYCPIATLFVRQIQLQKCRDLQNWVRGLSRLLEMSPCDRAHYDFLLAFYSNYGSISYRFWDIQCRKMSWPWNRGQWSLKVIESCTIRQIVYGFLLVFFNNFVRNTHRFWDIRLQKCCDLENRVRGPLRSLEISPIDREPMTFYWCSIVAMALSHVVSEIFNVEKYRATEIPVKS